MMYVLNYSLDNLSLMALTIAVGFVVDDAIVMLENVYRHIEDGLSPLEATLKGAREVGFTIMSISISLVAVFIPLLLMGGIIGRLFREFADHHDDDHRGLGLRRADPVAHHVRPVPARREARASTAGLYMSVERAFDRLLAGYTARPRLRARSPARHVVRVPGHAGCCTVVLYVDDTQGFLPAAGHRHHHRPVRTRRRTSRSTEMVRRQHLLTDILARIRTSRATAPASAATARSTTASSSSA